MALNIKKVMKMIQTVRKPDHFAAGVNQQPGPSVATTKQSSQNKE